MAVDKGEILVSCRKRGQSDRMYSLVDINNH